MGLMNPKTSTQRNKLVSPFKFKPFSRRQKIVLTWWIDGSQYSDYEGIIADGSIRSGKSMSMSLSFAMWATECFTDCNFAICGRTVGSVRRNVVDDLKRMLKSRGYDVTDRRGDNMLIISRRNHVNYFYLFGGSDERSQDLIQGITLAGVLLDEAALMPESFVNQATGRCSVEGAKLWFNCNPAGSRVHWFKTKWINQCVKKRLLYLHFTMDDNLSLSEKTKEKYKRRYVGMFYRRYIEGRWVAAEGVIYDMWNPSENTYDPEDAEPDYETRYRRYIAVDYGTTNPMVFLDVIDDGMTFWVKNEYYYDCKRTTAQRQKTDYEYGDDFEKFVGGDHSVTVIIDPSALSFRVELRNRGYRVKEADNEVLDGIRMTATLIQKRRIRTLRGKCPNFQHEIETYIWDEKAAQHGDERPVKESDHAMDAIRYLVKTTVNRRRLAL